MREGKLVGQVDALKTEITPGVAKLYALMPYRVSALGIEAPRRADVGKEVSVSLVVKARGRETPGCHIVRVELTDPAGRQIPHYTQNLRCDAGQGELHLTFALNDPPGEWRLTARDTATGVTASTALRLQEGK